MLYDDNLIEKIEYTIYNKWFDEFNINEDIIMSIWNVTPIPQMTEYFTEKEKGKLFQ